MPCNISNNSFIKTNTRFELCWIWYLQATHHVKHSLHLVVVVILLLLLCFRLSFVQSNYILYILEIEVFSFLLLWFFFCKLCIMNRWMAGRPAVRRSTTVLSSCEYRWYNFWLSDILQLQSEANNNNLRSNFIDIVATVVTGQPASTRLILLATCGACCHIRRYWGGEGMRCVLCWKIFFSHNFPIGKILWGYTKFASD